MATDPRNLADALADVQRYTETACRDAKEMTRHAKRLELALRADGIVFGDVGAITDRIRNRASQAANSAERIWPIALEALESYPGPGLMRIGWRLFWIGAWSWAGRKLRVRG